nr:TadA family conjugal transfer-associated ATPase [Cryobacterium algoricola]
MPVELSAIVVAAPVQAPIAAYLQGMLQPFIAVPSFGRERMPAATGPGERAPVPVPVPVSVPERDLAGLGPLAPYAASAGVTDLFVNGEAGLWVDAGLGPVQEPGWRRAEAEVRALAVRLIALGGRHIDEASPCVDVRLADGIRVHAVLPPVSSTGTLLSIRLPRPDRPRLAALAAGGLCGSGTAGLALTGRLRAAVQGRENLLVTGAAGSGKTTLLAALLGEAPPGERIVVIEDVAELRIDHPHVVALESRQPNLEGAGGVGLDALLREALRMRPDRLVLGECRGGELRELLAALNTGHDGGAGTLHANSLGDVPARLEALGALAGMSQAAVARQAVSAIGLVLHLERRGGERRLAQLGRFELDARGLLVAVPGAVPVAVPVGFDP